MRQRLAWWIYKPRIAANHQIQERGREHILSYSIQKEHGPVDTLISDFCLPEL